MTESIGDKLDPFHAKLVKIRRTATIVLVEVVILAAFLIFQLGVQVGQRAATQSQTKIFPSNFCLRTAS